MADFALRVNINFYIDKTVDEKISFIGTDVGIIWKDIIGNAIF